jgi:hypothetical protein
LLAKLELCEAALKGRYLFIEFRHVSQPMVCLLPSMAIDSDTRPSVLFRRKAYALIR